MTIPQAGWYPDPAGAPGVHRWWSGSQWTSQTQVAPPPPAAPPSAPAGPDLAGYGVRLGGWLLDFVIVGAISIPLLIPFGGLFHVTTANTVSNGSMFTTRTAGVSVHGLGFLVQAILVLVYGTVFIGSARGQTPGMMIAGIRCVDANLGRVGYARALLRAFVEYVLAVLFFIPWVIDMLFPLWDWRKQTIHDKAAASLVIHRERAVQGA
ncbi:MAG TPA: RDD family protein [Acidimicrobiales bacterium]